MYTEATCALATLSMHTPPALNLTLLAILAPVRLWLYVIGTINYPQDMSALVSTISAARHPGWNSMWPQPTYVRFYTKQVPVQSKR